MMIHGNDHTIRRQRQAFTNGIDDPNIRLMRNEPVNLIRRYAGGFATLNRTIRQCAHRKFEHGLAIHAQERVAHDLTAMHLTRYVENIGLRAIGM